MALIQTILLFCCMSILYSRSFADFESALIGPEYCGQGQLVWCSNFTTAAECNAVKHCIQTVWLTHELAFNSKSCENCESMVDELRQNLDSGTTSELVQELFENVCKHTRITELFRKRCEKYVDQYISKYFNKLLDLLKSDLNPAVICHLLQFCSETEPIISTSQKSLIEEDVVVRFENVILHFPAKDFINVQESEKLIGSSKCTWGPSYWCSNITSSKECQATSHCIQKVWSTQEFIEDNDEICSICIDTVREARGQLQINSTRIQLTELFENSCKLIPLEEIRNNCFKLVNEFVPELIEILSSELNPVGVCTVVGLCNSARIDNLLTSLSPPSGKPEDSCVSCTAGVLAVGRFMEKTSEQSVLDILLRVCDQLSSFSDACSYLITANFASIYKVLSREMLPFPVCHLNGMCAFQYHLHGSSDEDFTIQRKAENILANADDTLSCDLCKQFVTSFKNILTVNTTEDEFREMLEGICKQTGQFEHDCLQIVDDSFVLFYKYLTEELNPSEFCRDMKLCPKGDVVSDEKLNLISDPASLSPVDTRVAEVPFHNSVADVECQLCKNIIKVVQKEINNPKYQHDVTKLLEEVCSLVPKNEKEKCDEFVDVYSTVLIKILVDETDPSVVCSMLHICPDRMKYELCPLCKDVMNVIHEEVEDPLTTEEVQKFLEHVCRYFPQSKAAACKDYIDNYSELIISVLAEESDPSVVCPALNLCPSFVLPIDRCSQCQTLMVNFTEGLNDDFSKANVVDRLRTLVPTKRSELTLTALQLKVNYREDIIDMMGAEFDAQESCLFLHFCEASMLSEEFVADDTDDVSNNLISPENNLGEPSCELCELIVQLFENELTSNATEIEIEQQIQKFCVKLRNAELRSNCSHFVMEKIPKLMQLLKHGFQPKVVCREANLCPTLIDTLMNTEEVSNCELCEAVVNSFTGSRTDPLMMQRSIVNLIQICDVFGDSNKSQCMKVISYVIPQLESASLRIPSWYYCTKIDMCPYGAHLVFKKVCADSTQWCLDAKKAVLCDKLSYCQENVWKSDKPGQ